MFRNPLRAGVASFALALATLAGGAAHAQAGAAIVRRSAGGAGDGTDPGNDIIVTGTHIARPELESTMPIRVITAEDAKNFGRNTLYDALLLNPAVGPGLGEMNSLGQEYDQGVANINLRQMGANRSLVVVDGHRWVSGGARTSAVDLNTIPTALIDRIETVTGGAAAIYGADAVTGAVNIVMKKEMTGPERHRDQRHFGRGRCAPVRFLGGDRLQFRRRTRPLRRRRQLQRHRPSGDARPHDQALRLSGQSEEHRPE
jgi:iron complex outermembrane receptor protein